MVIQYYGHSCFKMITKPAGRGKEDVNIFFDPFDKKIGLRPPQGQADVVLVSHAHSDHNNAEALRGEPYVIDIPGEYSAKGVNIIGIDSYHDNKNGAESGNNTIFVIESEELRVCHLGDLGTELTEKQLEKINGVDILMIPVGGNYTIDGKMAKEIVKKIEPSIIIPMHYKMKGTAADVKIESEDKFCAEMGNCPKNKVSRINIKKKELKDQEMQVILMDIE